MEDMLEFKDPVTKKIFKTSYFKIVKKKKQRFAFVISPEGNETWRLLSGNTQRG